MTLIQLRQKLQNKRLGKSIIKCYHYLISVPLAYFYNLKYLITKRKIIDYNFIDDITLLTEIKDNKKSLCRFGDGEIAWIYRDSKGYFGQENSLELSTRLKQVLQTQDSRIFIGIPNFFGKMEGYDRRRKFSRNVHLAKYAKRWMKLLNPKIQYADALITRVYLGRNCNHKHLFELWKHVWENRDIIIIEGQDTKFGVGNDLLASAKSIGRILVPSENAFAIYDKILCEAKKHSKAPLYLLAIGPTATILAYDLAVMGYQAIDIGHLDIEYEWYIRKAKTKIKIAGKYINEAGGMPEALSQEDDLKVYQKQIISRCYVS